MAARNPRILSATSTNYDSRSNVLSVVEVGITYDGLKGGPVDFVRMDPIDALDLAQRITKAAVSALRSNERMAAS